jgi:hypothetical protein
MVCPVVRVPILSERRKVWLARLDSQGLEISVIQNLPAEVTPKDRNVSREVRPLPMQFSQNSVNCRYSLDSMFTGLPNHIYAGFKLHLCVFRVIIYADSETAFLTLNRTRH